MNSKLLFPLPVEHTKRFYQLELDDLGSATKIILASNATETRGQLPIWQEIKKKHPEKLVMISQVDKESIKVQLSDGKFETLSLRSDDAIAELVNSDELLLDVSGLQHNLWAPIIKGAVDNEVKLKVLYAEPDSYKLHPAPASASLFDLSASFEGLSPLPGFAKLSGPEDENKCIFIALLGFEGNRPERLALQLDPAPKVIPIVGVPGFQAEFPTFTIACNRALLHSYHASSDIRYARASCPFEVYQTLKSIREDFPEHYMYLAPVGTKPHSIGAIRYAIENPEHTEIMFDYPVRKTGRTKGVGLIHIYNFENFNVL